MLTLPTGNTLECLLDTGAAVTVLKKTDVPKELLTNHYVNGTGLGGRPLPLQRSKPTSLLINDELTPVPIEFLTSPTCPVNLLGADILSIMQATIQYTPQGIKYTSNIPAIMKPNIEAAIEVYLLQETAKSSSELTLPEWVTSQVPDRLWSKGKMDTGLLRVQPVHLQLKPGTIPVSIRQYPLTPAQTEAITKQIQAFQENGIIVQCRSPWNTPLFPVKKKGQGQSQGQDEAREVQYRLVHDLREVNKRLVINSPIVPNPHTLLNQIPPSGAWFTVIDLTNAYFSVPITEESQAMLAFTHDGRQYCWTRLPQGGATSPSDYTEAMSLILQAWRPVFPENTQLIQYVDDLLLSTSTEDQCKQETVSLLKFLEEQNCRASKAKLQLCQKKVIFLGHCISQGARHLTEERKRLILQTKVPKTIKQTRSFLGLVGYCREWIPHASIYMQVLYDSTKKDAPIYTTEQVEEAVQNLKAAIASPPALGLPDYTKPFTLYCHEERGHALGVITQTHGSKQRPVAYLSSKLDNIIQGAPTCIRAVAATAVLKQKCIDIVLNHELIIQVPHAVTEILQQARTKHLSAARLTKYEVALLSATNVTIKRCTTLNPATLLPALLQEEGAEYESLDSKGGRRETYNISSNGTQNNQDDEDHMNYGNAESDENIHNTNFSHDCMALMEQETQLLPHVTDTALPDAQHNLYVDGSRYYDNGTPYTGYAVTTETDIIDSGSLPAQLSAQAAELIALTKALEYAENTTANIYTDSRYAWGITQDYGQIWKSRDFKTVTGKQIQHADLIKKLFEALDKPIKVAIIKIQAHTKNQTKETRGNNLADAEAKRAAKSSDKSEVQIMLAEDETQNPAHMADLQQLIIFQNQAGPLEKATWLKKGAIQDQDTGLWKTEDKTCLPRVLYSAMCQVSHGITHAGKDQMTRQVNQKWIAPGFQGAAEKHTQACWICGISNPGSRTKTPAGAIPKANMPFQRLQIDYIQMPTQGPFQFVLVCVDTFSKWVEAFPVAKATAKNTAKKILTEIVCRYGVPEVIESDRGSHFTGAVMTHIMEDMGIQQAFHTAYRPQASGPEKNMNYNIKAKLMKAMQDTGKGWVDCLPLALFSLRTAPNKKSGYSPYEILFGSIPKIGCYYPQELQHKHGDLTAYVKSLTERLTHLHVVAHDSLPDSTADQNPHHLQPGDWVYLKRHVRKSLEPRYDGPFQVLITTPTSVKLKDRAAWVHASHCKLLKVKFG
ncbi:uncharacterized protein LOC135056421 [Pseudophryne corroboree]|uniref:uncharacterized protein LOC135056421 n=1 Tax=Pseudophryne corroboree TaxID=495146 RepID=UPI003081F5EE